MTAPQPPRLLDQLRQAIRLKHYSLKTEKSYVHYVRNFILFHNKRHPKDMGADEIRAYLSHLAIHQHVAASTQNVALSALLFLYRHVLQIELPYIGGIERAKTPEQVPVVFTRPEVTAILTQLDGIHHLIASLLHGSGLRLTEGLQLRVKDFDFEYRQITVRDGKGKKRSGDHAARLISRFYAAAVGKNEAVTRARFSLGLWYCLFTLRIGTQISKCKSRMGVAVCLSLLEALC